MFLADCEGVGCVGFEAFAASNGGSDLILVSDGKPGRGCVQTKDKTMINSVKKFLKSEDGPTAVEYAVMLALIVVVCLTAVRAIGTNAAAKFNDVKNSLT
jgi:pilus assembly protein Flp/PilA